MENTSSTSGFYLILSRCEGLAKNSCAIGNLGAQRARE
jgi:hypothetical protein